MSACRACSGSRGGEGISLALRRRPAPAPPLSNETPTLARDVRHRTISTPPPAPATAAAAAAAIDRAARIDAAATAAATPAARVVAVAVAVAAPTRATAGHLTVLGAPGHRRAAAPKRADLPVHRRNRVSRGRAPAASATITARARARRREGAGIGLHRRRTIGCAECIGRDDHVGDAPGLGRGDRPGVRRRASVRLRGPAVERRDARVGPWRVDVRRGIGRGTGIRGNAARPARCENARE